MLERAGRRPPFPPWDRCIVTWVGMVTIAWVGMSRWWLKHRMVRDGVTYPTTSPLHRRFITPVRRGGVMNFIFACMPGGERKSCRLQVANWGLQIGGCRLQIGGCRLEVAGFDVHMVSHFRLSGTLGSQLPTFALGYLGHPCIWLSWRYDIYTDHIFRRLVALKLVHFQRGGKGTLGLR